MLEQLINLLRRRPRKRPRAGAPEATTPYVSFRVEGAVQGGATIWVLDRDLHVRSRYQVWWN